MRDFTKYFNRLLKELPLKSKETLKNKLFAKLNKDLRIKILKKDKILITYNGLITLTTY